MWNDLEAIFTAAYQESDSFKTKRRETCSDELARALIRGKTEN
jgi:hypothetical protein